MCDFALKAQKGVVLGPWVKGGGAMDREKREALLSLTRRYVGLLWEKMASAG